MARQSSLQKRLEKNFDLKTIMMALGIIFIIWVALYGWDYIQSNADLNAAFIAPLMAIDPFMFVVVMVIFLAIIGYVAKRKMLKKKR